MRLYCPGTSLFRQPRPLDIACPHCKKEIEIWTDEFAVQCPFCKKQVVRDPGASCLDWCKSARECVGEDFYRIYLESKKTGKV